MLKIYVLHKHVELSEPDCAVLSFLCVYFCLCSLSVPNAHAHLLQISLIVSLVNIDYVEFHSVFLFVGEMVYI